MKWQIVCPIVLATALLLLGLEVLAEQACQITVREGMSLQAAISLAPAGAVICLEAGVWRENLVITKPLTVQGMGPNEKSTIMGYGRTAPVIRVEGDQSTRVTLNGITVMWGPIGIAVVGAAQVIIVNSAVRSCGYGIAVAKSAQATVTNSSVADCEVSGVYVTDSALVNVHNAEIKSTMGWFAIHVDSSARALLTAATITDNTYTGVVVGNDAQADIRDSLIENNGKDGIAVGGSACVSIIASKIVNNKWRGIALGDSAHVTLINNHIAANGMYGVFLYEPPCAITDRVFLGYLTGQNNIIPDVLEPEGNQLGAVCPQVLQFLATKEGGELDRRQ